MKHVVPNLKYDDSVQVKHCSDDKIYMRSCMNGILLAIKVAATSSDLTLYTWLNLKDARTDNNYKKCTLQELLSNCQSDEFYGEINEFDSFEEGYEFYKQDKKIEYEFMSAILNQLNITRGIKND